MDIIEATQLQNDTFPSTELFPIQYIHQPILPNHPTMGRQISKHLRVICPVAWKCIRQDTIVFRWNFYVQNNCRFLSISCDVDLHWLKVGLDLILVAQMSQRCVLPQSVFFVCFLCPVTPADAKLNGWICRYGIT